MWGKWGMRSTIFFSQAVLLGALMAYNVLMNSSFFNIINGVSIWITGESAICNGCWDNISSRYTPFIIAILLSYLGNFQEKKTYVKMNSGGLVFVLIIIFSIIALGFRAIILNTFTINGSNDIPKSANECSTDDWNCVS